MKLSEVEDNIKDMEGDSYLDETLRIIMEALAEEEGDEVEINRGELERTLDSDKVVEVPKVGMMFNFEDEVYGYYAKYAQQVGFGIVRRSSRQGDDGKIKYFTFACSQTGKTISTAKNTCKPNPTKKTNCKAKLNVTLCLDGRYAISSIILGHNHELGQKNYQKYRRRRKSDLQVKRRVEINDQARGHENLPFGETDSQNYVEKLRRPVLGDAEVINQFFIRMQDKNSKLFHVMDLDKDGRLRSVFWADARIRAAYESFGDVISFETTYLIDKYVMPFAPFVGVNHHGQSVLLGCGILLSEDIETYVRLFQTWLACMGGHPPDAIITDQCKAIEGAVAQVFPKARHRLCLWHIMRRIPEKLREYSQFKAIKKLLKNAIYNSMTSANFDENWNKLIMDYNLESIEWLGTLYASRERWVPVYVKETFWAGMSTTRRSENKYPFFDGYFNNKTTLKQFLKQFNNALRSKVEKESQADFASFNTHIPLITHWNIEKQFQEVYTIEKFIEFQDELRGLVHCDILSAKEEGAISIFEVADEVNDGKSSRDVVFNVCYNEVDWKVKCSCRLFEFKGILCRHAISVLRRKRIKEIQSHYILTRWRKDLKRKHNFVKSMYDDSITSERVQRYDMLCSHFCQIAEIGAESNEKYELLMRHLHGLKNNILNNESTCNTSEPHQYQIEVPNIDQLKKNKKVSRGKKHEVDLIDSDQQKSKKDRKKKPINEKDEGLVMPIAINSSQLVDKIGTQESLTAMATSSQFLRGSNLAVGVNYPNSMCNQTKVNQIQYFGGNYGGVDVNTVNSIGNGAQLYPVQFMAMNNQLRPNNTHWNSLQGQQPYHGFGSNTSAYVGSLPHNNGN